MAEYFEFAQIRSDAILAEFKIIINTYTDVKKLYINIFKPQASNSYKNISTLRLVAQCSPCPSVDMFNRFKQFLLLLSDKEI